MYFIIPEGISTTNGQNSNLDVSGTPLQSPRQANQDSTDDGDDDDDPYLKNMWLSLM